MEPVDSPFWRSANDSSTRCSRTLLPRPDAELGMIWCSSDPRALAVLDQLRSTPGLVQMAIPSRRGKPRPVSAASVSWERPGQKVWVCGADQGMAGPPVHPTATADGTCWVACWVWGPPRTVDRQGTVVVLAHLGMLGLVGPLRTVRRAARHLKGKV